MRVAWKMGNREKAVVGWDVGGRGVSTGQEEGRRRRRKEGRGKRSQREEEVDAADLVIPRISDKSPVPGRPEQAWQVFAEDSSR